MRQRYAIEDAEHPIYQRKPTMTAQYQKYLTYNEHGEIGLMSLWEAQRDYTSAELVTDEETGKTIIEVGNHKPTFYKVSAATQGCYLVSDPVTTRIVGRISNNGGTWTLRDEGRSNDPKYIGRDVTAVLHDTDALQSAIRTELE